MAGPAPLKDRRGGPPDGGGGLPGFFRRLSQNAPLSRRPRPAVVLPSNVDDGGKHRPATTKRINGGGGAAAAEETLTADYNSYCDDDDYSSSSEEGASSFVVPLGASVSAAAAAMARRRSRSDLSATGSIESMPDDSADWDGQVSIHFDEARRCAANRNSRRRRSRLSRRQSRGSVESLSSLAALSLEGLEDDDDGKVDDGEEGCVGVGVGEASNGAISIHFDEVRRIGRGHRNKSRDSLASIGSRGSLTFDDVKAIAKRASCCTKQQADYYGDGGGDSKGKNRPQAGAAARQDSAGSLSFDQARRAIVAETRAQEARNDSRPTTKETAGAPKKSLSPQGVVDNSLTGTISKQVAAAAAATSPSDNDCFRPPPPNHHRSRRSFSLALGYSADAADGNDVPPPAPSAAFALASSSPVTPRSNKVGDAVTYQDKVLGLQMQCPRYQDDGRRRRSASMDHRPSSGAGAGAGNDRYVSVVEQMRREREERAHLLASAGQGLDRRAGRRSLIEVCDGDGDGDGDIDKHPPPIDALASWLTRPRKRESIDHMKRMAEHGSMHKIELPPGLFVAPMECENLNGRWRNAVRGQKEI